MTDLSFSQVFGESYTGENVWVGWQIAVMALNAIGPAIAFITNGLVLAYGDMQRSERGFNATDDDFFGAASWAFGIWSAIYFFLVLFILYQLLPSELVPGRSDEMIYYYMNLVPMFNIMLNACWFAFAIIWEDWALTVSTLMIWTMLATGLYVMTIADQFEVWWPEVLLVRIPWSLYTGWLVAASTLSGASMFKSWGMRDGQTQEWMDANPDKWTFLSGLMFISEEEWLIVWVWCIEIMTEIITWANRDPVFGLVFAYAAAAVIDD